MLVILNEFDSDDEKNTRVKTREWVKMRRQNGFYNNIVQELKLEDRFGFKEMFHFRLLRKNVLSNISQRNLMKGTDQFWLNDLHLLYDT